MANTLVTGGAGFIGSHVATKLVELGHRVRIVDDFSTGHRANLAHLAEKIELIEGDIRDPAVCRGICEDIEFVFHEAAIPSVPKSIDNPQASHDANINGTFNILSAAVDRKVRRVIYAGSSSAYGDTEESPKHEGIKPAPLSPYAVQKLAGELYCAAFYECFDLETITLRYFNVFGPRQDPHSTYAAAIPAFVTAILRGEPPTVYGDGEQTRDFTYIDNVVHGNMLAMQAGRTHGETVNLACGDRISVNRVIAAINELLKTQVKPRHVEPRPGDVRHSCADVRLAKKALGFEGVVTFEEGLERTIEYYRSMAV
jgi:UDP-glucose 4-epimerase